jgi:hypothetical protein
VVGLSLKPCPAASAGIAVTGVPAATPGYDHGTLPGAAWHGSWHGAPGIPVQPVPSVRFPVSSMQPVRTVHGAVVMVRRRSTIRFRNGTPGRENFSNNPDDRRGTSRRDAPWRSLLLSHSRAYRELVRVAAGGHSTTALITAAPAGKEPVNPRETGGAPVFACRDNFLAAAAWARDLMARWLSAWPPPRPETPSPSSPGGTSSSS